MSSTQTRWTVESKQALEGLWHRHWKGDHPFFAPVLTFPAGEPLWVQVTYGFVLSLVLRSGAEISLDCGSAGTGLYVVPFSPWARGEIEEKG